MGKHSRSAPRRSPVWAGGLTAAAAAASVAAALAPAPPLSDPVPPAPARAQLAAAVRETPVYAVRPGDTLFAIAREHCGDGYDYPSLVAASGIRDPDLIVPGEIIRLACHAASASFSGSRGAHAAAVTSASGYFGCAALEALWEEAGGPAAEAFMAAEVATAESGGDAAAVSPTDDWGLWQVNKPSHGSLATLDPLGNARAAVAISSSGTDWEPWVTYQTGAYRGRC